MEFYIYFGESSTRNDHKSHKFCIKYYSVGVVILTKLFNLKIDVKRDDNFFRAEIKDFMIYSYIETFRPVMNSTVIHGIFPLYFFSESEFLHHFHRISPSKKGILFCQNRNR